MPFAILPAERPQTTPSASDREGYVMWLCDLALRFGAEFHRPAIEATLRALEVDDADRVSLLECLFGEPFQQAMKQRRHQLPATISRHPESHAAPG